MSDHLNTLIGWRGNMPPTRPPDRTVSDEAIAQWHREMLARDADLAMKAAREQYARDQRMRVPRGVWSGG